MFARFTLGAKLAAGIGLMAAILLTVAVAAYQTMQGFAEAYRRAAAFSARSIALNGTLRAETAEMMAGQLGVVLFAARTRAIAQQSRNYFRRHATDFEQTLKEYRALAAGGEAEHQIGRIDTALRSWLNNYDELERLAGTGDADASLRFLGERIYPVTRAIIADCALLQHGVESEMARDQKAIGDQGAATNWLLLAAIVLAAMVAAIVLRVVGRASGSLRELAGELTDGAGRMASAAGEVAASSQALAQDASEQAASLEETSACSSQITSTTRSSGEHMQAATGLMQHSAELVAGANRHLAEMTGSMKEIQGSSDKISRIIKVIDEIAFQTNILALNAAVEAARAGEAGMGFAVVADEVRNLAQRSAQAARDTAQLIEDSIAKSAAGAGKLDEVARSIGQITQSSTQVKALVEEIQTGSEEQARGIQQIGAAVSQMEEVTQRSAASAEHGAAASMALGTQAKALHEAAARLCAMVGRPKSAPLAALQSTGGGAARVFPLDEDFR